MNNADNATIISETLLAEQEKYLKYYNACNICPKNCRVNRNAGELGFCLSGKDLHIARFALHYWEEPPISGSSGSAACFFTGCNLSCVFCQNCAISTSRRRKVQQNLGKVFQPEDFVQRCFTLQEQGACNINLVTAVHQLPALIPCIYAAKAAGLQIPFVYNSSAYESVNMLKELDGLIDIYLPDLKFYQPRLAAKYLGAEDYLAFSLAAVSEMYRQVGKFRFQQTNPAAAVPAANSPLMASGMIIRFLLLPNLLNEAKALLSWAYTNFKNTVYYSLMNQYTPLANLLIKYPELNKHVSAKEYEEFIDFALNLGIENAFTQDSSTQTASFIPDFTLYRP